MSAIQSALIWAAATIVFALLATSDAIESEVAQTMLITLPALAWITLNAGRGCAPCSGFRGEER